MNSASFNIIEKNVELNLLLAQLPKDVAEEIASRAKSVVSRNPWPHVTNQGKTEDIEERIVRLEIFQARAVLQV